MIKQQQRVIKKGDYYEMQTYEEAMMLISRTKKQDTQTTTINPNSTSSEYILSAVPTFQQAREKYFCTSMQEKYSQKNICELRDDLQVLANEEGINDEDRKEIQKLMEEIQSFKENKEVPLNDLPKPKESQQEAKSSSYNKINLTARYNIKNLSQRIQLLEGLDFPSLLNLEHQLEIMLGEKKPLQSMQLPQMDQKQKQEFNNLYNHLNSLSILNNTQTTIDSISMNEEKHVEMQSWTGKMQKVQGLNNDFLMELKQDSELIEKLEKNFGENVKQVREILAGVKKTIASK